MVWRAVIPRPSGRATGGPPGFGPAVLPHLDAAYNLARWLVRDATLAEDVVQDALVRALAHFDGYRGGDARAWLLRIVRNAAYDALAVRNRGAGREGTEPPEAVPDPADGPEAALQGHERSLRLDLALAALPADLRECLVLRELEDLSYQQIAQITAVPVGTVMSRLWRARRALAGSMEDDR